MKRTLQYLLIIIFTFGMPLLTSLLLDLDWITGKWSREFVVHLLMLLEMVWGIFMAVMMVKMNKQSNK